MVVAAGNLRFIMECRSYILLSKNPKHLVVARGMGMGNIMVGLGLGMYAQDRVLVVDILLGEPAGERRLVSDTFSLR